MLNKVDDEFLDEVINSFNEELTKLKTQRKQEIPLCADSPGTSPKHCAFIFEWAVQAFLARIIRLATTCAELTNCRDTLGAAIIGRALVETVAHLRALIKGVQKCLDDKKFPECYHLISSFTLGGGKANPKPDNMHLKKLNIQESIRSDNPDYRKIYEGAYDWLSEISHPNAFGTSIGFTKPDKDNMVVRINDNFISDTAALSSVIEVALPLSLVSQDIELSKNIYQRLLREWIPSIDVCDLFEKKL